MTTQAYDAFMEAGERNTVLPAALGAASPGRVVLDIGTGRDALWAITAARAGARQVYAVEAQATVPRRLSARSGGRGWPAWSR